MYPMYLTIDECERHPSTSESWAASVLADDDALIFSTRVNAPSEPLAVEIGITDVYGAQIFYRRIRPGVRISSAATQLHGITEAAVEDEQPFADVFGELTDIVTDKRVILYNSFYDYPVIQNELHRYYSKTHRDHVGNLIHPFFFQWLSNSRVRFDCFAQRYGHWKNVPQVTLKSFMWRLDNKAVFPTLWDCESVSSTLLDMTKSKEHREIQAVNRETMQRMK